MAEANAEDPTLADDFNGQMHFRLACGLVRQPSKREEALAALHDCKRWCTRSGFAAPYGVDRKAFMLDVFLQLGSLYEVWTSLLWTRHSHHTLRPLHSHNTPTKKENQD